ncbi:hypothetical protein [Schaalia sp. ZJ1691]|uniref:hypothetical protein n=1 Tax=Schaalia sp. ZJ1691 TaxID=2709404 RepID=UPI0013EA7CCE|nr:hypothetical protein [Schaalia sp. ZJ1691]
MRCRCVSRSCCHLPCGDRERGDVPGWVLITLMTAALVMLIWGIASDRLVALFNQALDSIAGI